jgi:hypothetical protein
VSTTSTKMCSLVLSCYISSVYMHRS